MTTKTTVSRQKRKRQATHESIMHNAKRLFEEKGLGKVTIEEITEATDISRSTFFSHFESVDALISEISDVAVKDIIQAYYDSGKKGIEGIRALLYKLIEDTCPYPYLAVELFLNGIIKSRGKTPFSDMEKLICDELEKTDVSNTKYTREEQSSLIIGAYFGTVFRKFIKGNTKWDKEDIKKSIDKILNNIIGE